VCVRDSGRSGWSSSNKVSEGKGIGVAAKAKTLIMRGLVTVVVIVVIIVLAVQLFGDRALRMGIETAGSRALAVPVTLDEASLSILGGDVNLEALQIHNPEGYSLPTLLELDRGRVETHWSGLLGDPVRIDRIRLDGVVVVLEQKGLKNNLAEVLGAIDRGQPAESSEPGKALRIGELVIQDVKVQAKLLPLPGRAEDVELTLKPIRMTDLGTDSKLDMAELIARVVVAIAGGIVEQGGDMLPTEMLGPMKDLFSQPGRLLKLAGGKLRTEALKQGVEAGKALIEQGKEQAKQKVEDIGEGVKEEIKGVGEDLKGIGEGLKGLLQKDEGE